MSRWVIYILQCADGSFYTGITNNLSARLAAHNAGRGAKYVRGRLPVQLVYTESAADRSAATKREYAIKRLDVAAKRGLIAVMSAASPVSEAAIKTAAGVGDGK